MMKLWYSNPAAVWSEALPVGNGRLGGMVFGGVDQEVIQLNEDSVWNGSYLDRINPDAYAKLPEIRRLIRAGKIPDAERLARYALSGVPNSQRAYQTAGELYLNMLHEGDAENYRRELDLEEGIVKITYTVKDTVYKREVFASYPDGVLVVRLMAEGSARLNFDCTLERCRNWNDAVHTDSDKTLYYTADAENGGIAFCVGMQISVVGGTTKVIGEHLIVENASEALICLNSVTSFRSGNYTEDCLQTVNSAIGKGYSALMETHTADYRSLFGRLALSFECDAVLRDLPTDERLRLLQEGGKDADLMAVYFQYSRYLLISSSREGSLPATLQGIWNDSLTPPWDSKYTININTQMNYWLAESANLSECHRPLFDHLERMKENGKRTARLMYGCNGSVAHHNTDIYADTAPQDRYIPASYWVMGEAWLATHVWEHYMYTLDKAFLRDHFDILEQCVFFFYDFLIESADGSLVTSPSVSPENTYIMRDGTKGCVCEGPAMDVEILTELFNAYVESCDVLGLDPAKKEKAVSVMKRFPPLKIGKYGQLQEWMEDYEEEEPGHRHISHLYAIYPGTTINWEETPELMKAARISLERRLANGGGHTGWSRAWIIGLWARFGEGEKAYENFLALLKQSTFPNLMDNHPAGEGFVFQIDGNFGASAALMEMLAQCRGDTVQLLPALPKAMKNGSIKGLCLRGGGDLSMCWKNGKVTDIKIRSEQDRHIRLIVNGSEMDAVITGGIPWGAVM